MNLDCVVAAQRPKLSPHKEAIVARIAEILGVDADQINLKAKTGEGVGPVGREETIEARCVALIERRQLSIDATHRTLCTHCGLVA